jgi:hypothetical protein
MCQLSNALYQCALDSGFEIVERHAHTRVIPGSSSAAGRDATVFWNYVDLRFRSRHSFRVEARLTRDNLVVRFKGTGRTLPMVRGHAGETGKLIQFRTSAPRSCETCGVQSCFRNLERRSADSGFGRTAFLVDRYWPEFDEYIRSHKTCDDLLGIPINGRRWRKSNYAWGTRGFKKVGSVPLATLRRSRALRSLPPQGAARQHVLLRHDRALAESLASLLSFDVRHVVVSQNLLPFLWADGHLGGRTFDVLMTRLPMERLQARLDRAQRTHQQSKTLSDFRADARLVTAESEALSAARNLITPNADVARLFPGKAVLLDWHIPRIRYKPAPGNRILFPASALGRKGAYEMREAARLLGLQITVMGSELEAEGFWQGLAVTRTGENWLNEVGLVVLPAFVEDQPRRLLEAVASGVPVIASEACGLQGVEGVTTIPEIEPRLLAEAIRRGIERLTAGPDLL